MQIPFANILRRLDRHWLLNHPFLWIMRLHWMAYFWLLGLTLLCLIALTLPVTVSSVSFLNVYFLASLALAGLAVSPWVYLQVRFAPQLRQSSRPLTAAYLLLGHLFILGINLVWPYAFVSILEVRISNQASVSELREDRHTLSEIFKSLPSPSSYVVELMRVTGGTIPQPEQVSQAEREEALLVLQRLALKYLRINLRKDLDVDRDDLPLRIRKVIQDMLIVKGVSVETSYDPREYHDYFIILINLAILLIILALRIIQSSDIKGALATLVLAVAALILIALYSGSPSDEYVIGGTLLLLFVVSGCATFWAPRLKHKKAFVAVSINAFTLTLVWLPLAAFELLKDGGYLSNVDRNGATFLVLSSLGFAVLLAVAPWIQRRCLALQAKPS